MPYLYVPFGKLEKNNNLYQLAFIWMLTSYFEGRKAVPVLKVYRDGVNQLNAAPYDEKIYILAHGNPYHQDYVASLRTADSPVVSYDMLADRLKEEGLRKNHRKIVLYICSAGGNTTVFAHNFYNTMHRNGYNTIDVYYYEAAVGIPTLWNDGQYHKEGLFIPDSRALVPRFRASEVRKQVQENRIVPYIPHSNL